MRMNITFTEVQMSFQSFGLKVVLRSTDVQQVEALEECTKVLFVKAKKDFQVRLCPRSRSTACRRKRMKGNKVIEFIFVCFLAAGFENTERQMPHSS